ncbi:MAG: hypothetical protein LDL13_08925, partial [Calditerrivibrio sp.]|nr:hypothetical protein [Calditerrivibrio sp.]
ILYYNKDKNYIDFMDDAIPASIGFLACSLVELGYYTDLEEFDMEFMKDFLSYFHLKYPLGTPTIGVFLEKYRLKKEVL